MRTATIKQTLLFVLLGYVFTSMPLRSSAQYAKAADYPFIAGQEEFQYLVGGTLVTGVQGDDATATNIPIGFSFPFCNNTYTTGSFNSNAWFSLSASTAGSSGGICNDNNSLFQFSTYNSLPIFWLFLDDLAWYIGSTNPVAQASYLTTGTAPNRVFTAEWKNWSWDFSPIQGTFSIQLKLYENGSFKYLYKRESGPIASDRSVANNATGPWFGATIGFASTLSDYQCLDGSTQYSRSSTGPIKINIDARPFTNQTYSWMAPCTGVVSAEIIGPSDICPDSSLKLAAVTESMGLATNCIWYYSDDEGTTWNTAAPTTGILSDAIKKPRLYKAKVTCGAQTFITPTKLVDIAPHYKCYCKSTATQLTTNSSSSAMDIGNIDLIRYGLADTILKNYEPSLATNTNIYSVKAYSDFTQEFAQLPIIYRDSVYTFNANVINWNTTEANGVLVAYIDYNHNSIFDDFERIIYKSPGNSFPIPYVAIDTFRVSDTALIGITRMRVILKAGNTYPDSCGTYAEGETEDYLVRIQYPPCFGPVNAGTLEGEDTSMCSGYTYILTDTAYEKTYSGLKRTWQHSADDVFWYDIPNTIDKDSIQRLFVGQPLYYRVKMTCTHTNDETFTDTFKINVKPGYKCYCYSLAEGGMINDSSDIGGVNISTLNVNDGGTHLLNSKAHRSRTDRTDLEPLELIVDSVYKFFVYHTMPRNDHADAKITVFFDFNNNHMYDIPYERVFTGFTAIGYHTLVNNVIIPNNVIVGMPTGMRVILNNDVSPNVPSDEACGPYLSGETEDFIVVFKRPFKTNIENVNNIEHFSVFPNPTPGRSVIQFNNDGAIQVSVMVKDITGRQVLQQDVSHPGGIFRHEIDLSGQPKGMYIIEVNAGGHQFINKLTVQ